MKTHCGPPHLNHPFPTSKQIIDQWHSSFSVTAATFGEFSKKKKWPLVWCVCGWSVSEILLLIIWDMKPNVIPDQGLIMEVLGDRERPVLTLQHVSAISFHLEKDGGGTEAVKVDQGRHCAGPGRRRAKWQMKELENDLLDNQDEGYCIFDSNMRYRRWIQPQWRAEMIERTVKSFSPSCCSNVHPLNRLLVTNPH